MSQPYGPPQPGSWQPQAAPYSLRPLKTSTTGARVLTLLGVLLLVVAVVVGVVGIRSVTSTVSDPLEPGGSSVVIARGPSTSPVVLEAEAGRTYSLVALDPTSARTVVATADVTGPDGEPTRVVPVDETTWLSFDGFTISRFASFTATSAGTYTIEVTPGQGRSWDVAVADPGAVESLARDFFLGVVLIVVGAIGAGVGLVLSISGGIWWGVRRSNQKKIAAASGYGYGPQVPRY